MATPQSWTSKGYLISTDSTLVSPEAINAAFASDQLNWAKKLPIDEIKLMVESSVNFGIYTSPSDGHPPSMIGYARLVTDNVTIAFLTDVYVLPEHQRKGLSTWLIDCVKEWIDRLPNLRQVILVAHETKEKFYARKLGTERIEDRGTGYRLLSGRGPGVALS